MWFSLGSYSQVSNNDTTSKKATPPQDRNMFGLHIPRGLKVNNEGLADGYILFAVPNSPYVYLLNRRADVAHQWKCSYSAFNAYLQDDGSIIAGVFDPDFPTFGFGGDLMGGCKK